MTISTDLDSWWAVKTDYDESNAAKGKFQEIMTAINDNLDALKVMYDNWRLRQVAHKCEE